MNRKQIKFNQRRILNIAAAVFAAVILAAMPISMLVRADGNSASGIIILTRTAPLVSLSGSVNPHGEAVYEVYDSGQREIEIEAENINAADGTILNFLVDGVSVGQTSILDRRARLKLKTENGQPVPNVNTGSTVQVKNGSTIILNGSFAGGNTTPTVTPTVSPTTSVSPSPGETPNEGDLFAGLSGSTLNGVLPNGFVQYELHSSRRELEFRLNRINVPAGTNLTAEIDNVAVGQMAVNSNEGRLRLRSDEGQNVPTIVVGSTVKIRYNGTFILAGVFSGFAISSPTVTPTVSPSPALGRYFESHLTGSQLTPAVTGAANGEVKVLLNEAETQATLNGEFHNLSIAQTGARIEVRVGSTSVVHNFAATGGRNGNFALTTINVSPVQVQQLRAGLWFAVISSVNNPNGEIGGKIIMHSDKADFDGDGRNDFAVFRPSIGVWYAQNNQGFAAQSFGAANDTPVSADFDGDGRTDKAVFRNVNQKGVWEIHRSSDTGVTSVQFGLATDLPLRGDFDGDGQSDITVFRPSNGTWYIQKSNGTGFIITQFGINGDIPVAADMDGDGKHDITVFRPETGCWYWLRSSDGGFGAAQFGQANDQPIAGDFDGDGKDDLTVYRPSNGVWYILRSADNSFDFRQFGTNGDIPVAGNYDGDSKTDIAVFRPSNGIWYIWRSLDDGYDFRQFGLNGDVPVIAR